MARFLGIVHRTKKTAKGEKRPTTVSVLNGLEVVARYQLADETDELDFLLGRFPIRYRPVQPSEDLSAFRPHQIRMRKDKTTKKSEPFEVPDAFDGLQPGDTVAMTLGGSGDRFAFALSKRGEAIGATVMRIPPFYLASHRGKKAKKDGDDELLARLVQTHANEFAFVGPIERNLIRLAELVRERQSAQQDRKACGLRLRQHAIGQVFLTEEGQYPEGTVKAEFERTRASNTSFRLLEKTEDEHEKALRLAVRELDVWKIVFEPYEGVGEVIAGQLIAAIGDPRRFKVKMDYSKCTTKEDREKLHNKKKAKTRAKIRAFCGVFVMQGGKYADVPPDKAFPRQRRGSVAPWNPVARQALYNLADQFNKRPDSEGGVKLRYYKALERGKHPEPVQATVPDPEKPGQTIEVWRYTDAHIHKRALWRTLYWWLGHRLLPDWLQAIEAGKVQAASQRP